MKMRKSWLGLMAGAMIALSVTACDPGMVDPENPMPVVMTEVNETNSFELLAQPADFYDATVEQEMREKPEDRRGDNRRGPAVVHPFGRLLNALKLTEEQRTQVAELLKNHKACAGEALAIMKENNKAIMEKARAARAEIIAQVEAGTMTKEDARAAIRALNERVRNALRNSDLRERVREMLKSCDAEFLRALRQILTEEQVIIFDRWLASRPS
ncbi:MAG: hypothetical protein EHM43_05350 [Ignavibacteriae bacterium]|nr:MAG: hypothetical protein EHM43_05350 [Ignavibacteriota bacterium]